MKKYETLSNKASDFYKNHDYEKALAYFEQALKLSPDNPDFLNNIGVCLSKLGRYRKAVPYFDQAIKARPDYAEAYCNFGNLLRILDMAELAERYLQKAIDLKSNYEGALLNMSIVKEDLNKLKESENCLISLLNLNSQSSSYLANTYYLKRRMCDWKQIAQWQRKVDRATKWDLVSDYKTGETPFINILRTDNKLINLKVAQSWAKSYVEKFEHTKRRAKGNIRVGYLSENFRNHPVGHCIRDLFANHNRDSFTVYAYSYGPNDKSQFRKKVEQTADNFVDLRNLGDQQAAQRIYDDKIDILVDLAGYTRGNRFEILAYKPAPIQVSYLAFPGTTGANYMDYFLTDRVASPESHQAYFSEQLLYLPYYYQVNSRIKISRKKASRSDFGLPEDKIVLGCFNRSLKITPRLFEVWLRLLKNHDNCVLWLYLDNAHAQSNMKQMAVEAKVDLARLIFYEKRPIDEHLAHLKLADIILDTYPYSGGATSANALRVDKPVVTLEGKHFLSRMSTSLLRAAHLDELIAGDLQEYEVLISKLIINKQFYQMLVEKVKKNRRLVFDTKKFTNDLEQIWKNIFEKELKEKKISRINKCLAEYYKKGDYAKATRMARKLAILDPRSSNLSNLGYFLIQKGELDSATGVLTKAIAKDANNSQAYANLALLYDVKRHWCDWNKLKQIEGLLDKAEVEDPFNNLLRVDNYNKNLLNAIKFSARFDNYLPVKRVASVHKKIRVGYVSNGLKDFPTGHNLLPVLQNHDRKSFEVYAYTWGKSDNSDWEKKIKALVKTIDVDRLTDEETAVQIAKDSVDILVDLKGYTKGNRMGIFAHKPAAIQIEYLGFPGTTGAEFMDYIVADSRIVTRKDRAYFRERVLLMPGVYRPMSDRRKQTESNKKKLEFVFGNFNQSYKITPQLFAAWMRVLKRVPRSVLWQLESNNVFGANLKREARAAGVDPKRIVLIPDLPKDKHLERMQQVDLALDTYPVGGHTTTVDCLSVGVPLLTLKGNHFASRVSASCLGELGMNELITANLKEYERKAVGLGQGSKALLKMRDKLNRNLSRSVAVDIALYTKHLEGLYLKCMNQHNKN